MRTAPFAVCLVIRMNHLHSLEGSGLWRPEFERDNCGFGLIAQMDGRGSHWLVETAITALGRMTHRGAIGADGKTGDGCGLLLKKPEGFLRRAASEAGIELGEGEFATGIVFTGHDGDVAAQVRKRMEHELRERGLVFRGWRAVPIDTSACGEEAARSVPRVEQLFVSATEEMDTAEFNRQLFVARRRAEIALADIDPEFYVCSLSSDVILYKGLVMPEYLAVFYPDLEDPELESSIAVFHQRFSTNTLPQWRLAQPFRYLAHNGEINTIKGNRNWANARASKLRSPVLPELSELLPLVSQSGSDSMSLDNMLEVLLAGGIDLFRAMRMLMPPAWQNTWELDSDLRAFLEYNSMHMEPWDGPAGVVLSDGRYASCTLDRNGLRPARYVISKDRHITLASEVGVYDYLPSEIVTKGRLKPGEMLAVDTQSGRLLLPQDISDLLKHRQPYAKWLQKNARQLRAGLRELPPRAPAMDEATLALHEKMFNVTFEERDQVLRTLAQGGQEAVGSMGDDTPFPVMSEHVRALYDSFRQQFAQVTNPPIDPLRETIVMSLETCLGREKNLFRETHHHANRLLVRSPVLSQEKFETLLAMDDEPAYANVRLDLQYDPDEENLEAAIARLADAAIRAVRDEQKVVVVLSDRELRTGLLPVPALLVTGAVHHALIGAGVRPDANIIVDTGTVRDSHQIAVLVGYGATCVVPWLAYETLAGMIEKRELVGNLAHFEQNYRKGINKGLMKILSKMGISTIASYRGAQLYEIVGLSSDVVARCFTGTTSRIQGMGFDDIEVDLKTLAAHAFDPQLSVSQGGLLKYVHGGEYHAYNPDVVQQLQAAVTSGEMDDYDVYRKTVDERRPAMLRDLLELVPRGEPIPLSEVEPVEAIITRFDSAGMSLGALSPEAHETLAEAMNRLGGRSNSGEGGEDKARHGTIKRSKIKQIASGRFGVTPEYLVSAEVLQIKIAQGAKPGEGGQLPGDKVNEMIAKLRHSSPGVALISPPPHHDIYSIEDLAQLIFDLKQVNPEALVSVKLVAEAGVGTVAAGVAKAYADLITISGYDGGTGASPLTSVKYAGSPWELGMSETHQVLRANGLRAKVRVQADGGLKTGPGRHEGRGHGRGELRLRHRAHDRHGLQVPAHLSPEQLRHGRRHAAQGAAHAPLQRQRREGHELHALRGRGRAPPPRLARREVAHRGDRATRVPAPGRRHHAAPVARGPAPAAGHRRHPGRRAALLHRGPQRALGRRPAGRADGGRHEERDQEEVRRHVRVRHPERPPLHRRPVVRRDREAARRHGHGRCAHPRALHGHGRAVLRRVERGRPAPDPRRRRQRLRRQGHGGREDRDPAPRRRALLGTRVRHRRQHLPLRRDRRTLPRRRHRWRALRGAELRRRRHHRGHRRPRLRVHDGRRGRGARRDGRELRRRHDRRSRVRVRPAQRVRGPLQPRADRHPPPAQRVHGAVPEPAVLADPGPRARHGQPAGPGDRGRLLQPGLALLDGEAEGGRAVGAAVDAGAGRVMDRAAGPGADPGADPGAGTPGGRPQDAFVNRATETETTHREYRI